MAAVSEHFDGDGDGIDLVVVRGVGKRADLFEKVFDPVTADKNDLSLLGSVCPGKRPCELVSRNGYTAERA